MWVIVVSVVCANVIDACFTADVQPRGAAGASQLFGVTLSSRGTGMEASHSCVVCTTIVALAINPNK